jgi:hypothetical protein
MDIYFCLNEKKEREKNKTVKFEKRKRINDEKGNPVF